MLINFLCILQFLVVIYLLLDLRSFKKSIKKAQYKSIFFLQSQEKLLHSLNLSMEQLSYQRALSPLLAHIPLADKMGIILSVKQITIPSVDAPYNASIGRLKKGYTLFFRYDMPSEKKSILSSHIGCVQLSSDFEPLKDSFIKIDTESPFSEDARFFEHKDHQFLIFNDRIPQTADQRGIRIASIHPHTKKIDYITPLQASTLKIEKNWTPFSYEDQIFFLYSISPQKVLELPDPQKNHLNVSASLLSSPIWAAEWGAPRGGTPAILVDGKYLSLFHSSFKDDMGVIWYVMGAYTFTSTPPFQITGISPYPILFQNIYQATHSSHANPKIRAIYPAGLLYEKRKDREIISVSCGENDSCVKIITMDKEALFASLKPVDPTSG